MTEPERRGRFIVQRESRKDDSNALGDGGTHKGRNAASREVLNAKTTSFARSSNEKLTEKAMSGIEKEKLPTYSDKNVHGRHGELSQTPVMPEEAREMDRPGCRNVHGRQNMSFEQDEPNSDPLPRRNAVFSSKDKEGSLLSRGSWGHKARRHAAQDSHRNTCFHSRGRGYGWDDDVRSELSLDNDRRSNSSMEEKKGEVGAELGKKKSHSVLERRSMTAGQMRASGTFNPALLRLMSEQKRSDSDCFFDGKVVKESSGNRGTCKDIMTEAKLEGEHKWRKSVAALNAEDELRRVTHNTGNESGMLRRSDGSGHGSLKSARSHRGRRGQVVDLGEEWRSSKGGDGVSPKGRGS